MSIVQLVGASVGLLLALAGSGVAAQTTGRAPMFETDVIKTSAGELKVTFVGHATLMFTFGKTIIHVDPVSREADYSKMSKADIILVTHEHGDHFDPAAIADVGQEGTAILLTAKCASSVPGSTVMKNGDVRTVKGLKIEARVSTTTAMFSETPWSNSMTVSWAWCAVAGQWMRRSSSPGW